jgi:hypothetical protein
MTDVELMDFLCWLAVRKRIVSTQELPSGRLGFGRDYETPEAIVQQYREHIG